MKFSHNLTIAVSGGFIPTTFAFLQEALIVMVPWAITMFFVIIADLAAGVWKSYKLNIDIRFSRGLRETMGKILVYFAFVCMIACINVAFAGEFQFAKWAAALIIVIEFGSIVSNLLKPHGINLSLTAIIKAFLQKSPLPITCEQADEIVREGTIDEIRKEEQAKAEMLGSSLSGSAKSKKYNKKKNETK